MAWDRTSPDQRRAPRVWVSFPATIAAGDREQSGTCTNVSTCGVFVQTDEPIDIGTEVRVEFEITGAFGRDQVLVLGSVARRVPVDDPEGRGPAHGHGVAFDRCMLGDDELREFIRVRLALDPEDVAAPAAAVGIPAGQCDDVSIPEPDHPALASIRRINTQAERPRIRWRWIAFAAPSVSLLAAEALLIAWVISALRDTG